MKSKVKIEKINHPIRNAAVFHVARTGQASPNDIANALGIPLNLMAYHVRILREANVLKLNGKRQVRGAIEHFYIVSPEAVKQLVKEAQEIAGRANVIVAILT